MTPCPTDLPVRLGSNRSARSRTVDRTLGVRPKAMAFGATQRQRQYWGHACRFSRSQCEGFRPYSFGAVIRLSDTSVVLSH
jgi:hypothetical protein